MSSLFLCEQNDRQQRVVFGRHVVDIPAPGVENIVDQLQCGLLFLRLERISDDFGVWARLCDLVDEEGGFV
jgi:hypothetical protein